MERITHEPQSEDAWVCICGNTPCGAGFSTCDEKGRKVAPYEGGDWEGVLYACGECGRIIDQDTLDVLGRAPKAIVIKNRELVDGY